MSQNKNFIQRFFTITKTITKKLWNFLRRKHKEENSKREKSEVNESIEEEQNADKTEANKTIQEENQNQAINEEENQTVNANEVNTPEEIKKQTVKESYLLHSFLKYLTNIENISKSGKREQASANKLDFFCFIETSENIINSLRFNQKDKNEYNDYSSDSLKEDLKEFIKSIKQQDKKEQYLSITKLIIFMLYNNNLNEKTDYKKIDISKIIGENNSPLLQSIPDNLEIKTHDIEICYNFLSSLSSDRELLESSGIQDILVINTSDTEECCNFLKPYLEQEGLLQEYCETTQTIMDYLLEKVNTQLKNIINKELLNKDSIKEFCLNIIHTALGEEIENDIFNDILDKSETFVKKQIETLIREKSKQVTGATGSNLESEDSKYKQKLRDAENFEQKQIELLALLREEIKTLKLNLTEELPHIIKRLFNSVKLENDIKKELLNKDSIREFCSNIIRTTLGTEIKASVFNEISNKIEIFVRKQTEALIKDKHKEQSALEVKDTETFEKKQILLSTLLKKKSETLKLKLTKELPNIIKKLHLSMEEEKEVEALYLKKTQIRKILNELLLEKKDKLMNHIEKKKEEHIEDIVTDIARKTKDQLIINIKKANRDLNSIENQQDINLLEVINSIEQLLNTLADRSPTFEVLKNKTNKKLIKSLLSIICSISDTKITIKELDRILNEENFIDSILNSSLIKNYNDFIEIEGREDLSFYFFYLDPDEKINFSNIIKSQINFLTYCENNLDSKKKPLSEIESNEFDLDLILEKLKGNTKVSKQANNIVTDFLRQEYTKLAIRSIDKYSKRKEVTFLVNKINSAKNCR